MRPHRLLEAACSNRLGMDHFLDDLIDRLPTHSWGGVGLAAVLAMVAVVLVHRIAWFVSLRTLREGTLPGLLVRELAKSVEPCLGLLGLTIVLDAAPDALPWMANARRLMLVCLILAVTTLIARAITSVGRYVELSHPSTLSDNLRARSLQTQARALTRTLILIVAILGLSSALMTFPSVRHIGASLLASAGIAGLVVGLAAKSVLGNLLAGLQLALTQPIRIDDVLIVQGEWGRVEEITGTYVVVRIWDDRRLIVPLQWFIENPFQNWTRRTSQLMGSIFLWLDYRMPIEPLRAELLRICQLAPEWDRRFCNLQVTDANEHAMQVRVLATSADSSSSWDLRCRIREALIAFIQQEYPQFLPRSRMQIMALGVKSDDAPTPFDGNEPMKPMH